MRALNFNLDLCEINPSLVHNTYLDWMIICAKYFPNPIYPLHNPIYTGVTW